MNKCIDCKEQIDSKKKAMCCICMDYIHSSCAKKDSGRFYCKEHWAFKRINGIAENRPSRYKHYNVIDKKTGFIITISAGFDCPVQQDSYFINCLGMEEIE